MAEATPVHIPLLNPNEPTSRLSHLYISTGSSVKEGDLLATCESTKGVEDLVSPQSGFVCGLTAAIGDTLHAGETLCWVADTKDWSPPERQAEGHRQAEQEGDVRITKPARELAESLGITISDLPADRLITSSNLLALAGVEAAPDIGLLQETYGEHDVLVYGGGGHGKSLIELIRAENRYAIAGVIDDGVSAGESILDVPVLGGRAVLPEVHRRGVRLAVNAVGGIGNIQSRVGVFQLLIDEGFQCPPVVHPSAWVEPSAKVGEGVQVFPHAYVGSDTNLSFGVIVNTSAVVSHDCRIGPYANIAPGSLLAGNVSVGEAVLIGMGVTINLEVGIGARARIGNSAVVKSDVPAGQVVRAGSIWPVPAPRAEASEG